MSEPQNQKNWPDFDPALDPDGEDGSLDIPSTPEGEQPQRSAGEARVAELEALVAELKDQALRNLAETENVRRRAQRDIEDAGKYAVTKFARDLLSVADNLGRALAALPADHADLDDATKNVLTGVEATERELKAIFERNGIKRIEPLGEAFNPEYHQAVMEVPTAEHAPGTVALLLAPGYLLKDRLLRPAMVGVAKAKE
jgi:molecular chaperone GrpE